MVFEGITEMTHTSSIYKATSSVVMWPRAMFIRRQKVAGAPLCLKGMTLNSHSPFGERNAVLCLSSLCTRLVVATGQVDNTEVLCPCRVVDYFRKVASRESVIPRFSR